VAVPIWGLLEGPGRFTVRFDEPIVPRAGEDEVGLTGRMMASIEAVIRERPEQWLWYHDRWRRERTGEGRKEESS
jgi:lauroyl/myristoyl acyltransferase